MLRQVLEERRAEIVEIASKYGAGNIRVFGSVVRGEDTTESDVDFLVDFEPQQSLFDRIALTQDLEDLLGRQVQIVTRDALHPFIKERILQQAIPL